MMTHHAVHESFKNNISNNTNNIAQKGPSYFQGGKCPLSLPKFNPGMYTNVFVCGCVCV